MTQETLKWFRIATGGGAIAVTILSLFVESFVPATAPGTLDAWYKSVPFAVVGLGLIYRTTGAQKAIHGWLWRETIDLNIRNRLLSVLPESERALPRFQALTAEQALEAFWDLVNGNKSLTRKGTEVYENGALLGLLSDAFVLGALGTLGHWTLWLGNQRSRTIEWMIVFAVATIATILGVLSYRARHKRLSDDQLDVIRDSLSAEAAQFLRDAAARSPA
jgi:hypothetical protein